MEPTLLGAAMAAGYMTAAQVARELTPDMPARAMGAHRRQRGRDMVGAARQKLGETQLAERREASAAAARMSVIH